MPARWRWRRGTAGVVAGGIGAAIALAAPAPAARAQLLNLDSPTPAPRAGEGKAALALADRMLEEIERKEKALERLTGERLLASKFEIATRRLIRGLLMKAEELGEAGSPHALAGLTLHNRLRELDLIARRLRSGACTPEQESAAELFVARVERLHGLVPARVDDLDRALRDLLATPVQTGLAAAASRSVADPPVWVAEPGRVGWMATAGGEGLDLGAACERWAMVEGVAPGAIAAIAAFNEQTLREARQWWAYRGAAEAVAGAIIAAGRVAEPGGLPEWVPSETRASLAARFAAAAAKAVEPATREGAMQELADLAACAEVLTRFDLLLSSGSSGVVRPGQRAATAAKSAALAIVAATGTGSKESRAALAAYSATLRLLGERAGIGDERSLVRDARPAWRALEAEARRTEADLWGVLGAIAPEDGAPLSNPVIVAPLAAHRRSLDDLRAVAAISRHLGGTAPGPGLPGATPPAPMDGLRRGSVLARVLRLGQDLSVPERRESGLAAIRRLAADLEELMSFPGEDEVRAGGGDVDAVTGGRTAGLLGRIDAARSRWLEGLARDGEGAEAAADLRRCRSLVALVRDAATMRALLTASRPPGPGERFMAGDEGGIRAHPGWELSDAAAAAIYGDLGTRLPRATRMLVEGGPSREREVEAAIAEIESAIAPVRLAAMLEREARARRLAGVPVMVELAAPPAAGGGPWPVEVRAELAAICRYAEELAHATAEKDAQRIKALRAHLNDRARAALERLSPPGRGV